MEESSEKSVSKEEMEEDSNVITLDEFIEEETRLETDANALLGPSDDKNCTYSQGYMGRQALYACKTCRSEDGARVAGVCLACTYHCHEGHDLVELYTKRNFRCDCGNSRFKDKKCNLEPEKDAENKNNGYNHNFDGAYCTCKRPYPDPEDSVSDEMIQCIICEDWYHTRHLHAEMPPEENYAEMICTECTERLPFLNKYLGYSVTKISKEESGSVDVVKNGDSTAVTKDLPAAGPANGDSNQTDNKSTIQDNVTNGDNSETSDKKATQNVVSIINDGDKTAAKDSNNSTNRDKVATQDGATNGQSSSKVETVGNGDDSKVPNDGTTGDNGGAKSDSCDLSKNNGGPMETEVAGSSSSPDKVSRLPDKPQGCHLEKLKEIVREKRGATFWPHNFRSLLCSCNSCKEMYSKLGVSYLMDPNDTVQSYEEKGRTVASTDSNSKHSLDKVLGMLSNMGMDRFSQAEAILNYNDLKSNLTEYLAKFVENKKVVREEDIHEFFTQMKAKKRQKLDLPFNCR